MNHLRLLNAAILVALGLLGGFALAHVAKDATANPPIPQVRDIVLAYDPLTGLLDADYNTTFTTDTETEATLWACLPGSTWAPRMVGVPDPFDCGVILNVAADPPGTQYIVHVKWYDNLGGHVIDWKQVTKP